MTDEFPANLDTPAFRAAWDAWHDYRREAKLKPWLPSTRKSWLKKFSGWGIERSVAAIAHTIEKQYQGIVEPKGQRSGIGYEPAKFGMTYTGSAPGFNIAARLARLADLWPEPISSRIRKADPALGVDVIERGLAKIEAGYLDALPITEAEEARLVRLTDLILSASDVAEFRPCLRRCILRERIGVPYLSLFASELDETETKGEEAAA